MNVAGDDNMQGINRDVDCDYTHCAIMHKSSILE